MVTGQDKQLAFGATAEELACWMEPLFSLNMEEVGTDLPFLLTGTTQPVLFVQ